MNPASIIARFAEASTWGAISALLANLGIHVPDATWQAIVGAAAGFAGILGILIREAPKS